VILLGAFTRLTNAGLSCPDWPHCYGFVTAPHTAAQLQDAVQKFPGTPVDVKKAWTEMTHRYFAGTEGILILMLAGLFFFNRQLKSCKSLATGWVLLGLLGIQVLLGMLTVTEKLKPVIVLSHLLTGLSILAVLWWAYLDVILRPDAFPRAALSRIKPWLWLALIIVAAQITLGGWVSTHYAGLACIDLPYCNGKLLPTMQWGSLNTDLITIHMLHRIGAVITALYIGILSMTLLIKHIYRCLAITLLALVSLQITLGVLNVIWLRPVWIALIHHGIAIVLLLTIITAIVKTSYQTSRSNP
jgi:cytochrome c oxidase assembly protein subunit 15